MAAELLTDHAAALREARPLIDLRAPVEFERGALPSAVNLPLLSDTERDAVGKCYKSLGQAAAIELGEQLVSGSRRAERIEGWLSFVRAHSNTALYCWRGGLRSQTVQSWLAEAGCHLPRVAGGFKALRAACLAAIERASTRPLLVLGGRTGSGKTALLQNLDAAVDLEGLANHRGSAFGGSLETQPPPIGFENALAVELLRRETQPRLLLEDEGRTIGRIALPESLHRAMQQAPLVVIEVPREVRARHIAVEYVAAPLASGVGKQVLANELLGATDRIRKRLGGDRHTTMRAMIEAAFADNDLEAHAEWIDQLLHWYYDPMYDHQLQAKNSRIVARGSAEELRPQIDRLLAK